MDTHNIQVLERYGPYIKQVSPSTAFSDMHFETHFLQIQSCERCTVTINTDFFLLIPLLYVSTASQDHFLCINHLKQQTVWTVGFCIFELYQWHKFTTHSQRLENRVANWQKLWYAQSKKEEESLHRGNPQYTKNNKTPIYHHPLSMLTPRPHGAKMPFWIKPRLCIWFILLLYVASIQQSSIAYKPFLCPVFQYEIFAVVGTQSGNWLPKPS